MFNKQAFKIAFLKACADRGLTIAETIHVAKEAQELIKVADAGYFAPLLNTAKQVGTVGTIGALTVPPLAGWLGGYGMSRMTDIDDEDVDAIKTRELIDELRRNAQLLKHRRRSFRLPASATV